VPCYREFERGDGDADAAGVAWGLGARCFFPGRGVGRGTGSFSPGFANASISSAAVQVRAETMPLIAFPSCEVNPS
jgi:hypothetical protein